MTKEQITDAWLSLTDAEKEKCRLQAKEITRFWAKDKQPEDSPYKAPNFIAKLEGKRQAKVMRKEQALAELGLKGKWVQKPKNKPLSKPAIPLADLVKGFVAK